MNLAKLQKQALELQQKGRMLEAERLFLRILSSRPSDFVSLYSLGVSAAQSKEQLKAFGYFDKAVKSNPKHALAWQNRALVLQDLTRYEESLESFREAAKLDPSDYTLFYSMGTSAFKSGDPLQALHYFDESIKINPKFAQAWFNRGTVLLSLKKSLEALDCFGRALEIDGSYIDALINRGYVLYQLLRYGEALENYDRLLQLEPDNPKGLSDKGFVLTEENRNEEAVAIFRKLLKVDQDYDYAWGRLYFAQLAICQWDQPEGYLLPISEGIAQGKRICLPLAFLAMSESSHDHLRCMQVYARQWAPAQEKSLHGGRYRHDRIRVAYVSPDFREHPVGHLTVGIFENHDKSRFETTAVFLGKDDGSALHKRIAATFDHFIDARQMISEEVAGLMRLMEIDIVVDLAGCTSGSRSDIFTYHPAPIQATFLGYPSTTGAECIDYIIADRIVIPESNYPYFTEKVISLPDTYLPTDGTLKVSNRTPSREECGLPATGFVFCSFNHSYKINPTIFDVWMRILKRIPGSVLWLMKLNAAAEANLRIEAERRGVEPGRLIFATRVPNVEDHLARYRQADLFLDTTPYNAHTTASDALFVGLPVLTCLGQAFPGRVASSLLHAIGMPELSTRSLQEYEALAVELALDCARIESVKRKLAEHRDTYPLFDTKRFCLNLESAFISMWEREQRGEPPASFVVSGSPAEKMDSISQSNTLNATKRDDDEIPLTNIAEEMNQALALHAKGKLDEAEAAFCQILEKSPSHVVALYSLGIIALLKGDPDASLNYFDRVLKLNAIFPQTWFNRGIVLQALQRHTEAMASYDRALQLDPAYSQAQANRHALAAYI